MTEIDDKYSRDLFLLRYYYNLLSLVLNQYFKGDIVIVSNKINRDYLRICFQISTILKKPEFDHLKSDAWKPYSNLLTFDEYTFEEEWKFEKQPIVHKFLTHVESLYIEEGEKKYPLDKAEFDFFEKIKKNLEEYATSKIQKENSLFKRNPFGDFVSGMRWFEQAPEKTKSTQNDLEVVDGKFEVVLSFAGENRDYVEAVARYLKAKKVRVFYDHDEEVELWGKELTEHLDTIYNGNARFCVMFISKYYAEKMWTTHERRSALNKALTKKEYILPARFDNTEITGLRDSIGYVDLSNKNPVQLGELILKKLGRDV